jgi:hypothetical protein
MLQGNFVKIFNSTQIFKNVFVLKFELILIIGLNNVLMEGARKVYRQGARGRRVGQGWARQTAEKLAARHDRTDRGTDIRITQCFTATAQRGFLRK